MSTLDRNPTFLTLGRPFLVVADRTVHIFSFHMKQKILSSRLSQICLTPPTLDILHSIRAAPDTLEADLDNIAIFEPQGRIPPGTYSLWPGVLSAGCIQPIKNSNTKKKKKFERTYVPVKIMSPGNSVVP